MKKPVYRELVTQTARILIESGDPLAQVKAMEMSRGSTINDKADLVRGGLNSGHPEVQVKAAEMSWYASEKDLASLRELVAQKIRANLESGDPFAQAKAVEMMQFASLAEFWKKRK